MQDAQHKNTVAEATVFLLPDSLLALRWLARQPPDLEESRQLLGRIVRDGRRASNVVGRIRDLT